MHFVGLLSYQPLPHAQHLLQLISCLWGHIMPTPANAHPPPRFNSLKDFYPFYKKEHGKTGTRALHFVGTTLFLLQAAAAAGTRNPKLLLSGVVSAYGCAWIGHFFVENNRWTITGFWTTTVHYGG